MSNPKVSNVRNGLAAVPQRPSEQIIRAAQAAKEVTDALGRKLLVRKPGLVQKMRLFKVVGSDASRNEVYFGHAMLAASVVSIDGVAVDPVLTEIELEELLEQLGDEGIQAAASTLDEGAEKTAEEKAEETAAAARVFT